MRQRGPAWRDGGAARDDAVQLTFTLLLALLVTLGLVAGAAFGVQALLPLLLSPDALPYLPPWLVFAVWLPLVGLFLYRLYRRFRAGRSPRPQS